MFGQTGALHWLASRRLLSDWFLHGWFLRHLYHLPLPDRFLRLLSLRRRLLRSLLSSGRFRWLFPRGLLSPGRFRRLLVRGGLPSSLFKRLLLHDLLLKKRLLTCRRGDRGRQTFEYLKKGLALPDHAQLQPGTLLDSGKTLFQILDFCVQGFIALFQRPVFAILGLDSVLQEPDFLETPAIRLP